MSDRASQFVSLVFLLLLAGLLEVSSSVAEQPTTLGHSDALMKEYGLGFGTGDYAVFERSKMIEIRTGGLTVEIRKHDGKLVQVSHTLAYGKWPVPFYWEPSAQEKQLWEKYFGQ